MIAAVLVFTQYALRVTLASTLEVSVRLGFVCNWEREPERTWSHIPWSLRAALDGQCDLRDLGVSLPPWQQNALKAIHTRRRDGRWTTDWKWSSLFTQVVQRTAGDRARSEDCDAVLEIHDLARFPVPYYVFQDLSNDVLLDEMDRGRTRYLGFDNMGLDRARIERRRVHQRRVYDSAAGVFAMSRWFADHLINHTGLPADRVHVVHPGANVALGAGAAAGRPRPRCRVLFVGRDMLRKGGAEVVAAMQVLRRDHVPDAELTICGPKEWPLPDPPPAGVRFLGQIDPDRLPEVYAEHDVFVMPSHFEAFGIAFVEALANGLPCVGRRAYAMAEIIEDGVTGVLIDDDDPASLAGAIHRVLEDDAMFTAVAERAASTAEYYSWDRAARQIVGVIAEV